MSLHSLQTITRLPIQIDQAWSFFSSPMNLKAITPEKLGFRITSDGADQPMYAGMVISYIVKPILGIPMEWVTEITQVEDKKYFVDEQRSGPYAIWHHQHFFKSIEGGVEMRDIVHYKLPLGFLGDIVHSLFVRREIQRIFEFREKKMTEIFGQFSEK